MPSLTAEWFELLRIGAQDLSPFDPAGKRRHRRCIGPVVGKHGQAQIVLNRRPCGQTIEHGRVVTHEPDTFGDPGIRSQEQSPGWWLYRGRCR